MPVIPKESRLFLHYENNSLYCHGRLQSYQTDANFNQITTSPNSTIPTNKPFSHFYNAIHHNSTFYAIINNTLISLSNLTTTRICDLPSPSSEKYKLFSTGDDLLYVDDRGAIYELSSNKFIPSEVDFLAGDSYVLSKKIGQNLCQVAVNLTSQIVFFRAGEYVIQEKIEGFLTLDFMNSFYVLFHSELQNYLVDLTCFGQELIVYKSRNRVREIEWNRVSQFLEVKVDSYFVPDEFLGQFDGLDVVKLNLRIQGLFPESLEVKRAKSAVNYANDVWKFDQQLPIVKSNQMAQMAQNQQQENIFSKNMIFERGEGQKIQGDVFSKKQQDGGLFGEKLLVGDDNTNMQKLILQQQVKIQQMETKLASLNKNQDMQNNIIMSLVDLLPKDKRSTIMNQILKLNVE